MLARGFFLLSSCNALNIGAPLVSRVARRVATRTSSPLMIDLEEAGEFGTTDYVMSFKKEGAAFSPWHDAPLELEGGLYNMLTEIPKMTLKKMEVATKVEGNPIMQD